MSGLSKMTPLRVIGVSLLLGALILAGGWGYLSNRPDDANISCLLPKDGGAVCRFDGGPLEVAGAPVFVEDRSQALFPTRTGLIFFDAFGKRWFAPPRTLTDGASIPAIFATLLGDRQSREYVLAAAIHDAYCGIGNENLDTYHTRPWHEVHRMFYDALIVNGTAPATAKVMYAAVHLGGPRWNDPARSLADVPDDALRLELEWCLRWMAAVDPTASQITAWMDAREEALQTGGQREPDWDALRIGGV